MLLLWDGAGKNGAIRIENMIVGYKGNKIITFVFIFIPFAVGLSACDNIINGDSSQLLSILNELEYGHAQSLNGGHLPISENIIINDSVTISSEDLMISDICMRADYCSPDVIFDDLYDHEGISISPLSSDKGSPYILTLSDVTLRFRKIIRNLGGPPPPPGEYMSYSVMQIMPPSWYKCGDSQIRCIVDSVCYSYYFAYCLYCLTLSQIECDCRDENGLYDDGTSCMYITGDDTYIDGECKSGECEFDW